MKDIMVKGPGGWYIRTADDSDIRLNEDLLDAFEGNTLKKSIDFMSDWNHKGNERLHLKKGGDVNIKHPGALHRALDIPQGEKIPLKKLNTAKAKAEKTGDSRLMKQVTFAKNFRGK